MKTITLKLTEKEYMMFKSNLPVEEGCTSWIDSYQLIEKSNSHHLKVLKKDKFNKFIKIISPFSVNFKNIKSKFDKAVDKPEEGKIYALTGGPNDKCIANGDSWKDSVVQNDEPKSYVEKVDEEAKMLNWEQKQYHGDLDILKEGFVDSEYNDDVWCEKEWDGLGITYESVRQCSCSHCGEKVSELELRLFRKHSKVKEDLCKDCHSKSTPNLSMKEMAKLVMEYLPCHTDGDLLWTLENQFKRRSDLAYMLMVISRAEYEIRDDIWS